MRFALVGVCYISEEHARLLFEMKHDSLGAKELAGDVSNVNRTIVLVFFASVHWHLAGHTCVVSNLCGNRKHVVTVRKSYTNVFKN